MRRRDNASATCPADGAGAPEVRLGVPGVGVASSAIRAPFVWRVWPTRFVRLVQRV